MLSEKELLFTLALQRVPNLGNATAKKLLNAVGSASGIYTEKKSSLLKIEGIGHYRIKGINARIQLTEAEAELDFIRKNGIGYWSFLDPHYPQRLKYCHDAPILLFHKGNIDLKRKKLISVVGTRNITSHGARFCEQLLSELAPLDPVVISGFAYGVDITVQKFANQLGLQTIGCLAHGLDQIYPRAHRKYVARIEENGGFITEFRSDDPFERANFLQRNRIIAGLSEATIVIESAEKGGSLVTADLANSYHREVFSVPGRPADLQSAGCNNLIKTQRAHALTSAADLIYHLGWNLEDVTKTRGQQTQLFIDLNAEEERILALFRNNENLHLDEIAIGSRLGVPKTSSLLLELELKGLLRPMPGKRFTKL